MANWRSRPLHDRFHEKCAIDAHGGCWNWIGATGSDGYGRIRSGGRAVQATHVALGMAGKTQPSDRPYACHTCDNKRCVNPSHLWWGTASDNMRDMHEKQRHWASRERCPNGHFYAGQQTSPSETGRRRCRICSAVARKRRERANFVPGAVKPRWTDQQKITALTLHCRNFSVREIALAIGKSGSAVRRFLARQLGE